MFGVALALVPLFLFTYFGLSMRLLGDDYANLGLPMKIGTWEAMLHWREVWNGDYSNYLLYGLLAPLGTAVPPFFAFIIIVTAFVSYAWQINTVLTWLEIRVHRNPIIISLASLAVAAAINGFYAGHALYWFTAACEYTWPGAIFMLGIALATEAARRLSGRLPLLLLVFATAVYAFINAGFSEMFVVLQLAAIALIAFYIFVFLSGPKRRRFRILSVAACLGTFASLMLQVSATGFAVRSSATTNLNYLVLPVRELTALVGRTLELTMLYTGNQKTFAGFMLVAFAGMFVALIAGKPIPADSRPLRLPAVNAPIALALIVQLLFLPILWTHRSDSIEVLGRFSYAFLVVVGTNSLAILVLLLLLWRRRLGQLLERRNGLMIYCSCVLLVVCLLFTMTQVRSVHHSASSYLFFTVASLLIMLACHLTMISAQPRLNRLFLLTVYMTASAVIILAAMLAVKMYGAGFVIERTIASTSYALMMAGLLNGITIGALIKRGFCISGAKPVQMRRMSLLCLLVAFTIGLGTVIGQGRRIGYVYEYVATWESQHQEIIRLRDEGDPTVYTKSFARIITDHLDGTPPKYRFVRINRNEKIFYGLDGTRYYE